jgi:hypothetical protein
MIYDHVLEEVKAEINRQDDQWGGADHDDRHTLEEWVCLMTRHLGLSCDDGVPSSSQRFRKQFIRLAALAMQAVGSIDRKGGKIIAPKSDKGY